MGCNNSKSAETSNQNKPEEKPEEQTTETQNEGGETGATSNEGEKRGRMLSLYSEANEMASSEYEDMKRELMSDVTEERSNPQTQSTGSHTPTLDQKDPDVEEGSNDKTDQDSPEAEETTDNTVVIEKSQTESVDELAEEKKKVEETLESKTEGLEQTGVYIEDCDTKEVTQQKQHTTAEDDLKQNKATEEQQATEGNAGGD